MAGIGDMDPRELERAVVLVERISLNVERMTRALAGVSDEVKDVVKTTEEGIEETTKQIYDVRYEVEEMFKWIEQRALPRVEFGLLGPFFWGQGIDRMLEVADRKMKRWADEMKRHLEARGPLGTMGKATGITSIAGGLSNLKGQLFAGMPFGVGGLLGMALWGAKREEEFNAAARRAVFTLQQTGGIARESARGLTGQIRAMYQAWGSMGEEIEGTLGALAEFSIAEEAFQRTGVAARGFMQNITGVATAVDLMNAAQPGTTARLIGETMLNSSVSVKEASDQVFRLAANLREARLNYGLFGAGIIQATSALRIQNQSLDDTSRLFSSLQKRFEEQGMSKQRAAAMALSGVQAATGAIGGLPQGLQGFIAQRLASKGVEGFAGMKDPFALMVKMQEGLSKGGAFASPVFHELQRIAEKAAGTTGTADERRMRQIGTLQALGVSNFEAARAIVDGKDATEKLISPAEKSAKFTEDLNKAFGTRAANQSAFERDMRVMQDTLAQIGSDILTFITASGVMIIEQLEVLPLRFASVMPKAFGGRELTRGEQKRLSALDRLSLGLGAVQETSFSAINDKLNKIGAIAGSSVTRATTGRVARIGDLISTYEGEKRRAAIGDTGKPTDFIPGTASKLGKAGDEAAHNEAAAAHLREAANHMDKAAKAKKSKDRPKGRTEQPTAPRGH